jgi:ribosomal protein S18 acetylase RimI-like enzyme
LKSARASGRRAQLLVNMEYIKADIRHLEILTEMNICLREDEKIDNVMTDLQVKERMISFLNNPQYDVSICKNENEIVGYSLVDIEKEPKYLRQLFIKKEFRNNRFGKLCIQHILEKLKIKELDIEVMCWNESAMKFYEKCGFIKRYIGMRYK